MTASPSIEIAGRKIGPGHPTYVIAEMSANHLNDLDRAHAIVRAAADAGADCLKLQTYTPHGITLDSSEPPFVIGAGTPWSGRALYELYEEAYLKWEWQGELAQAARDHGMHCFSSPFDDSAVDFLETLDVPAYKIASFEIVDTGLIAKAASTGKPLIISTGMATNEEVQTALDAAREAGATEIALTKCTSSYPAPPEHLNLRAIPALAERFGVPVGLSDHTPLHDAVVAAVTLGACIVEKHLTLARADGGADSMFSLEPAEFRAMVDAVRSTEVALGSSELGITEAEVASRAFRRSLFVVADMEAGDSFNVMNLRSIRPADGLPPKHLQEILGRRATRTLRRGTPLAWDDVGD